MKIMIDLSETYHSNAEENLANHNDLKSYQLLTNCFILKYTISKKGDLDLNHVKQLGVLMYVILQGFFTLPDPDWQRS